MDFSKLFTRKSETETNEERTQEEHPRLPPGQYLTKKWPVLSYERTPKFDPTTWHFTVKGLVEEPFELTWEQFLALPRVTLTADFHCVTTWSRYDNTWEGVNSVPLSQLEPYDEFHLSRRRGTPMVAPAVPGIELFKIAGRSISGWMKSL